jgi:quinol monooxygenase YgiN
MTELVTSGTWVVDDAKTEAFMDAWATFAEWSSSQAGAGTLRLGRDGAVPGRYVSFAAWDSAEHVRAWKSNPDMPERLAKVLQYVDDFHSSELDVVVAAGPGSAAAVRAGVIG